MAVEDDVAKILTAVDNHTVLFGQMLTDSEQILENIESIESKVDTILNSNDSISTDVNSISTDVNSISTDVNSIKEYISSIDNLVGHRNDLLTDIGNNTSTITSRLTSINTTLDTVDNSVDSIDNKMSTLITSVETSGKANSDAIIAYLTQLKQEVIAAANNIKITVDASDINTDTLNRLLAMKIRMSVMYDIRGTSADRDALLKELDDILSNI